MSRRRKKPLPEPVATTVESLSHEGRGVSHVDGKTVFIDDALPGETVLFRYTGNRARFAEGYAVEIHQASPRRITPKCNHYAYCGGCSLQHLTPHDQIEHKQQVLIEQLHHLGNVSPENILPPLTGPVWGYRRKARLGVKYVVKKQKLLIGFREKRSNYLADLQQCEVLHPAIGLRLADLQSLIGSLDAYDQIPQLEVAVGQGTTVLIFRHLTPLSNADRVRLRDFQAGMDMSIYLQSGGPESVAPLDENTNPDLNYHLDDFNIDINFRPDDFTQINFDINNSMIRQVLTLLEPQPADTVLDLFCGLGNFSLPLARKAALVTGIEASVRLVAQARKNAVANGIENVEFHVIDLMQTDHESDVLQKSYHKILIDPPRNGAKEIIDRLDFTNVEKLVYVSCNPATLARDAGILVREKGLILKTVGIMDMFPQTSHVESMALFEHK